MFNQQSHDLLAARQDYLKQLELKIANFGELHAPVYLLHDLEQTNKEIHRLAHERTQIALRDDSLEEVVPPQAKGLILLISPRRPADRIEDLASFQAINHHRSLKYCWMLATSGERGSLQTAKELEAYFSRSGIRFFIWQVLNPAQVEETYRLTNLIYSNELIETGLTEDQVIADITGATKTMTAGMVLACGKQRPMQYMLFQQNGPSLPIMLKL